MTKIQKTIDLHLVDLQSTRQLRLAHVLLQHFIGKQDLSSVDDSSTLDDIACLVGLQRCILEDKMILFSSRISFIYRYWQTVAASAE